MISYFFAAWIYILFVQKKKTLNSKLKVISPPPNLLNSDRERESSPKVCHTWNSLQLPPLSPLSSMALSPPSQVVADREKPEKNWKKVERKVRSEGDERNGEWYVDGEMRNWEQSEVRWCGGDEEMRVMIFVGEVRKWKESEGWWWRWSVMVRIRRKEYIYKL